MARSLCALVVTYYPGAGFARLLTSISRQVGRIVVVDNHSPAEVLAELRAECFKHNCHLIENDANVGIARALNLGVRYIREHTDAKWVACFDQDTQPYDHQIESLLEILQQYPGPTPLGVIGSNYVELPMGNVSYGDAGAACDKWMAHDFAITSGALISLRSLVATGGFRDEFFIDCVDFDYSFRARLAGYETVISRAPLMAHTVGNPITRRVGRRALASSNHRAERRYYRVRNITVLAKEYTFTHPAWVVPRFLSMVKSVILMCWLEHERPRKLRYVARGLFDGLRSDFRYSPLSEAAPDPRTAKQTLRSS